MKNLYYQFKTDEERKCVENNSKKDKIFTTSFYINDDNYLHFSNSLFSKKYVSYFYLNDEIEAFKELKNFETVKALLNMSTVEEGIEGEWFKVNSDSVYQGKGLLRKTDAYLCDVEGNVECTFSKNYSIKPTVKEIVNFFENQTMEKTQTITRLELLEYIKSAVKLKHEVLPILQKHFPDIYTQKEFIVTKQVVEEVLEIIGDCKEWQDKLKKEFKGLLQKEYDFKVGELVFVSDKPHLNWEIARFKEITASYFYAIKNLSNIDFGMSYNYCVPMREVPQGEIPKEGVHYNL